ncbi:2874_t:CDS:2 [Funneliformis geosporum]|uniref:2874_t:CDS:1 n=1 Tax=Funneliformis geosporum TaxID=1117311 RepID=A0A9W4SN17_9GLOM|nr:2874_t:CDS:2 [Funneliformis geosporum]
MYIPKRMPDCNYFRNLWWNKGEFNPKAKWEAVTLPYKLAVGVTFDEFVRRSEESNAHGCWEWTNGDVMVYEWPSEPHEICIRTIYDELLKACISVIRTNARIYSLGSSTTRANGEGKEADDSYRPKKILAIPPNGSDRYNCPWPNVIVEIAYSESIDHVTKKVNEYWLRPNRERPSRMRAWHYCVLDRVTRNIFPARTTFEFGMQNGNGAPLNIQPGSCVINIKLDCLYHDLDPSIQIPRNTLSDPITLDFFYVQQAIVEVFMGRD